MPTAVRLRREPPGFRRVTVRRAERLTPRLVRVTLGGDELAGFSVDQPAASVRMLLPGDGGELVLPVWNGNEFLLPDGSRPVIRTFTPRHWRAGDAELDIDGELDIDMVVHGSGVASRWAERAAPGDDVAVSGPGRGYLVDEGAARFILAGDETAIPAMSQLLESLPETAAVEVHVEIADDSARTPLPERLRSTVAWHLLAADARPGDALFAAIRDLPISASDAVWVAGEAAGVQRIRRHLFDERGLPRSAATVRGYWKHGRAGGDGAD